MPKPIQNVLGIALFSMTFAAPGFAATCGTVESPTACSITVNGNTTYTVSNFAFGATNATGGGNTVLVTFSKHLGSPTPGLVFLANANQTSAFSFTYDLTISAAIPGTVAFATPNVVDFGLTSALNGGFSAVQMVLSVPGDGTSCQAVVNSAGSNQDLCDLPVGVANALHIGSIASLTGGPTGSNTSFGSFSHLISGSFTADTAPTPEPSSIALIAAGLATLVARRRR